MKRTFCDGCWRNGDGVLTDLTDLPPNQRWCVSITNAYRLDLCRDCAPRFEKFVIARERLLLTHSDEFKRKLKELQDAVWNEVRQDAEAKAEP